MSETMPSSSSEWLRYYHHTNISTPMAVPPHGGYSVDSTVVTTSVVTTTDHAMSPTNSSTNGGGQFSLSPKANVSKPIRRRSRASRRTPTTLLNASATNFRALVQQFTGCSSEPTSSPSSLGTHRGPHNLSFGPESENHVMNATTSTGMAPFGYYYDNQTQTQAQAYDQYMYQEQQSMYSLDNNASGNPRSNMQSTLDGFMMEASPLHEVGGYNSSNALGHDGYFFGQD